MSSNHAKPRRLDWRALVGVLLIAAAAYTSAVTYISGEQAQERAECQARVNDDVITALQRRDEANRAITEAQRVLITARLDPDLGGGAGMTPRDADENYLAELDRLQRVRDMNPLGAVPPC